MIISEQTGRLIGFKFDEDGFQFQIGVYPPYLNRELQLYFVPFNQNRPKAFDPEEFRGKRVKITVEMVEEK